MERLVQDLRYAFRRLVKKPAFTAVAIVSLTIGIGANTAIFSLVNAIFIRELPLERPEELVEVYRSVAGFSHATMSFPDLEDVRRETEDVFVDVAGSRLAIVQTDVEGGVEVVTGELVSGNYFPMLGVRAAVGRTLLPEDDVTPGGHLVVMLGHGFWQRRFAGDPAVVGQEIRLNGRAYSIVGVVPEAFTGNLRGLIPDLYAPTMMVGHLQPGDYNELEARGNQSVFAKARLRPGVSLVEAQAVVDRLAVSLREQYPGNWQPDNVFTLVATADVIMNPMVDRVLVPAAALMMVVVALVLLIACANLASFLLAQAADRRKEVALRLALGAKRTTLIQQLLTETVLLALVGGGAGLLLAGFLLKALVAADLPLPFPISLDLSLDGTVLGFSLLITAVAGVLFGLVPALQATNPDLAPTLKDESTGGGRPKGFSLRSALVVTQVAVSLVLLVGSGLFLRSLQARVAVDPGFGYEPAAIFILGAVGDRYTPEQARVFYRTFLDETAALPGVQAVGMTGDLHLSTMNNMMRAVSVDGIDPPPGQDFYLVDYAQVDPGFFGATGVQIVRGRAFQESDGPDGAPVAIVSEAFAQQFWPGRDAVGRTFRSNGAEQTVVGVARDAKVRSLGEAPRPFLYRPWAQDYTGVMTVVARTSTDARNTLLDMVAVARRLDPELLIYDTTTMERHLGVMILPHRLSALLVTAFGGVALLLACIGLYGVVSYAVSMRSREVGIRMSLGADSKSVVRMLLGGGMKLVAVGGVIGLVLSFASARLLGGLLYGIDATDPVAFVLVPVVLGVVALLAAWVPARRASAVDPVRALKAE
jgi:predicted permease